MATTVRIAFPEYLGLSRAVFINYPVIYPILPAPLVSKFATWFHHLAEVPTSLFVPVFWREQNWPKMCPKSAPIVLSGVPHDLPGWPESYAPFRIVRKKLAAASRERQPTESIL